MSVRIRRLLLASAALATVLAASSAPPGPQLRQSSGIAAVSRTPTAAPAPTATWKEIDHLIEEQKLAEASAKIDEILKRAQKDRDEPEWTRALVRSVQVRTGLHGYETAVRFLKEQPWPPGLLARTTLELFYAQALVHYEQTYSWEIGQRENVESAERRPEGLDSRADLLRGQERVSARLGAAAGALDLPVGRARPSTSSRTTIRRTCAGRCATPCRTSSSSCWPNRRSGRRSSPTGSTGSTSPASSRADGRDADARLADGSAHPVEKLVAILGDLEDWHAATGERAAELEARLERVRRLQASSPRRRPRRDPHGPRGAPAALPATSPGGRWEWPQLAEFRQDEDAPDNLVRAREVAAGGRDAYPQSPGGQRCGRHRGRIEAPDYELASMTSDGSDRRSIQVMHKNLSAPLLPRVPVDLERQIGDGVSSYGLLPRANEGVRELLRAEKPAAAVDGGAAGHPGFQAAPDLRHAPDARERVYGSSSRRCARTSPNATTASTSVAIQLGDLVLVTRPSRRRSRRGWSLAEARDGPSGGVDVSLYEFDWRSGRHARVASSKTGADGLARFDYDPARAKRSFFLLARRGDDVRPRRQRVFTRCPTRATRRDDGGARLHRPRDLPAASDPVLEGRRLSRPSGPRPVACYRPTPRVTVVLRDANDEVVETTSATTNAFGSAAGEFRIPAGRALGRWRVESSRLGGGPHSRSRSTSARPSR